MKENQEKKPNKIMTLFALASQMTSAILGLALIGYVIDNYMEIEENYFTLIGSLLGVFVGMYLLLKGVKNIND